MSTNQNNAINTNERLCNVEDRARIPHVEDIVEIFLNEILSLEKVKEFRKTQNLSVNKDVVQENDKLIQFFSQIDTFTGREQALSWDNDTRRYQNFNLVIKTDWWKEYAGGSNWLNKFATKLDLFRQRHLCLQVSISDITYRHVF